MFEAQGPNIYPRSAIIFLRKSSQEEVDNELMMKE
jgi:hypothetical protein